MEGMEGFAGVLIQRNQSAGVRLQTRTSAMQSPSEGLHTFSDADSGGLVDDSKARRTLEDGFGVGLKST